MEKRAVRAVKMSLNSFCKDTKLTEQIRKNVLEMSYLKCEMSRLTHFSLYKILDKGDPKEIQKEFGVHANDLNFRKFLYPLCIKQNQTTEPIDVEYEKLCDKNNLVLYDSSYKGNLLVKIADEFKTCFANLFHRIAYKRIKSFFYFMWDIQKPDTEPKKRRKMIYRT